MRRWTLAGLLLLLASPVHAQNPALIRLALEHLPREETGMALHPRFLVRGEAGHTPPIGLGHQEFTDPIPEGVIRSLPVAGPCTVTAEGRCDLPPGSWVVAVTRPYRGEGGEMQIGVSSVFRFEDGRISGRYFLFTFHRDGDGWRLRDRTGLYGWSGGPR